MNNGIPGPSPESFRRALRDVKLKIKIIDAIAAIIHQQKPAPQAYWEIVRLMEPFV